MTLCGTLARKVALAMALGVAGAAQAQDLAITVDVTLTPAAAKQLAKGADNVIVSAWYYGTPKPGAKSYANEEGMVDIAAEKANLGKGGGKAALAPSSQGLEWIEDKPFVNVNIFSGLDVPDAAEDEEVGGENVLSCDFFDGPLAHAQASPIALTCGLITEEYQAQVKS